MSLTLMCLTSSLERDSTLFLKLALISMICHLPEVMRLCSGHCLVAISLFNATEKVGLTDIRFPDLDPKSMLLQCSKMVCGDYRDRFDVKNIEAKGL